MRDAMVVVPLSLTLQIYGRGIRAVRGTLPETLRKVSGHQELTASSCVAVSKGNGNVYQSFLT
jgi:hypothetical protein